MPTALPSSTASAALQPSFLDDRFFSIKNAAAACGLSPSVLRVWEFRYGWPAPQRRPNGYRSFTRAQLDDIKRVANLIRTGMNIGAIIIDGFPRWPSQLTEATKRFPSLFMARAVPASTGAQQKQHVLQAIERGVAGEALAHAQAACLELRPRDEALAVILPILLALAELDRDKRVLANADELRAYVVRRANELGQRLAKPGSFTLLSGPNPELAAGAGLALTIAGRSGAWVTVDAPPVEGNYERVSLLGDEHSIAISALLETAASRAA